jgi:hypothetical protein
MDFASLVDMACAAVIAISLWSAVHAVQKAVSSVVLPVVVQPLCCAALQASRREVVRAALRGSAQVWAAAGLQVVRLPASKT